VALRLTRGWALRAAGSALVLGALAALLPMGEVASAFARTPAWLFLATLALFLLGHAVAAAKWRMLLGAAAFSYPQALRAHLAGLAALMVPFGPAPAGVVAAGLLWQAVLWAGGGIGGLVWALTGRSSPAAPPAGEKQGTA
jgi:hypothetical protein